MTVCAYVSVYMCRVRTHMNTVCVHIYSLFIQVVRCMAMGEPHLGATPRPEPHAAPCGFTEDTVHTRPWCYGDGFPGKQQFDDTPAHS